MSNNFTIIIITKNKQLSDGLKIFLESCKGVRHFLLEATTPDDLQESSGLGKVKITRVERAIAVSHHRARLMGLSLNSDFVTILEEDAIPLLGAADFEDFLKLASAHISSGHPTGIHLSPEQFGIMTKRKNDVFLQVKMLADCAVAYLLNNVALRTIAADRSFETEVADWPKIMKSITWLAPIVPIFSHPDLRKSTEINSSSSLDRQSRLKALSRLQKVQHFPYQRFFSFKFFAFFGTKYGNGYAENEKYRSRIIFLPY